MRTMKRCLSNINDEDRRQWIANDEGLYNWQRRSGLSMKAFIKKHRAEIDEVIGNVTSGKKRAHYLEYGQNPRRARRNPEFRLGSSSFVFAPGFVRWAMHGYKTSRGKKREPFVKMLAEGWGIPKSEVLKLYQGDATSRVEGDVFVFTTTGPVVYFNKRRR
jgi:hypothetical protein